MTQQANETLTLQRILFEHGKESAIAEALRTDDVTAAVDARLEAIPPVIRAIAREEVAKVVTAVLGTEVVAVLEVGWRKWGDLADAGRRSFEEPGESEIVELLDHRIISNHRPHIDIEVDGVVVTAIGMGIEITVDLHAVTAVVSGGRLTALRTGRADITVDMSIEDVQVAVASRQVQLPVEVSLGDGIPLVSPEGHATLPPPPTGQSPTTG